MANFVARATWSMGQSAPVATFDLPLTVRARGQDILLLVQATVGATLGAAMPSLLLAAGLPPGTALFWGLAPARKDWVLGQGVLIAGVRLSDSRADTVPRTASVLGLACVSGPDAGGLTPLEAGELVLGRGEDSDIAINDPLLSRRHAVVVVNAAGVLIKDCNSLNGIRSKGINQDRISGLESGRLIEIGTSLLQARLMCPPMAALRADTTGHLAVTRSAAVSRDWQPPQLTDPGERPTRTRKPLPVLAAMMAGLLGVAIAVVTGYWMFLMLAALGPLMMITNAISDRIGGRKSHRRLSSQFDSDAAEHRARLATLCAADIAEAWERSPDPATILQHATTPSARLWERRLGGRSWLHLRVGVGNRPARITGTPAPMIGPAPLVLDVAAAGVTGICGDARALLRNLIGQAAVLHSPAELHILIFSDQPDLLTGHGLPHAVHGPGQLGNVISTEPAAQVAISALAGTSAKGPSAGPAVLLIFDDASRWRRVAGVPELLARCLDPKSPLQALCLEAESRRLPTECSTVITVGAGSATLRVQDLSGEREGSVDGISHARFAELVQALVPLTDPDLTTTALPTQLELADLGLALSGTDTDANLVRQRWHEPSTHALLGVSGGKPITLDLDQDGPHFLIAGTTGSGKSELLQTLVATLALAAPPQLMSFLLMDYKGGAAFAEAADLPHTTGLVTDLDPGSSARVLTSLRAELHSREKLLAAAGLPDLISLRGRSPEGCPPRLVIVVDEFASLATDLPDFMDGLVDIAQRGRSLGVHLVLATQRPAGVVNPAIKANITGRICLRVTDDHDSADVIDSPLAATLPRDSPGRAYLRTSKGSITLFQTARVAGAWTEPDTGVMRVHRRLPDGTLPPYSTRTGSPSSSTSTSPSKPTVLQTLVRACLLAAVDLGPIRRPWLPPLPSRLTTAAAVAAANTQLPDRGDGSLGIDSGEDPPSTPILGLIDLPAQGRQELLKAPPGSVMFWGAARSGRSSALRTFARASVDASEPAEIAVVDPSGALSDLRSWPECGTYLDGQDPWLVSRLAERLAQELAARSRTRSGSPPSRLIVLIDGWESCVTALDALDFGVGSGRLLEIATRGQAAGLFVGASAEPRIQHTRAAAAFTLRVELGAPEAQHSSAMHRRQGSGGGSGPRLDLDEQGGPGGWPAGRGRLLSGHSVQLVLDPPRKLPSPAPTTRLDSPDHRRGLPLSLVIQQLPDVVRSSDLPLSKPESLLWAVGDDDARPIGLNSTLAQSSLLVAGPRRSGVSTTLNTLIAAARESGVPVLQTVRTTPRSSPGLLQVNIRNGPAELEAAFARHEGALLVVADDGHELQELPAGSVLAKFLLLAGPGQNLILGLRADRLGRSYRGLIAEIAAYRRGILLQPDGQDGAAFDLQLPRRRKPGPAGRGVLADCGVAIPVQVALSERSTSDHSTSDQPTSR